MGAYTTYDFECTLDHYGLRDTINLKMVEKVIAAWGNGGPSEWEGGFLVQLKDGRYAYVWGWNDYTGWGCQDGALVEFYDEKPDLIIKRGQPMHLGAYIASMGGNEGAWDYKWDEDPIDLNRFLAGEITAWG